MKNAREVNAMPSLKNSKVQIYVPPEDWVVIAEINRLIELHKKHGFRTSFSAEALKVWKIGLATMQERRAEAAAAEESARTCTDVDAPLGVAADEGEQD